jgi:hypothetical protein
MIPTKNEARSRVTRARGRVGWKALTGEVGSEERLPRRRSGSADVVVVVVVVDDGGGGGIRAAVAVPGHVVRADGAVVA